VSQDVGLEFKPHYHKRKVIFRILFLSLLEHYIQGMEVNTKAKQGADILSY
jgi:hypothetical protein